jgi:uncharacterized metal-binding protein YceD (DUF177 family)
MGALSEYNIEIFRLSDKVHTFDYEINDSFFLSFEGSYLSKGNLKATVTLNKSDRYIRSNIIIHGEVELTCDRSLEPYLHSVDVNEEIIFNYGDEYKEVSENILIIPRDTQRLNFAQYIYELIGLMVPMKKLHPKYQNEEHSEGQKLVYTSENKISEDEEPTDPRWNALKNIKKQFKG